MTGIDTDYLWLSERPQPRKRLHVCLLLLLVMLIAGMAWLVSRALPSPASSPAPKIAHNPAPAPSRHAALRIEPSKLLAPTNNLVYRHRPTDSTREAKPATNTPKWRQLRIHKGDTLSLAFSRNNLAYADAVALARLPEYGKHFSLELRPGDTLRVKANAQGHVLAVKYPLDPLHTLRVQATNDGYEATVIRPDLDTRVDYATGTIRRNFYTAAREAGLTQSQTMKLVHIFQWTLDLGSDLQSGDRFTVVYNELYKDGQKVANGHILAASFRTGGNIYRAVRFAGPDDKAAYYQSDGSAMKPAFMRHPVDYAYISSPFNLHRYHPILHKVRPHTGTDYAARVGTPIHAASDGVIIFRGRNGGYGNMVTIDHGHGITTRYAHMSRFASGQHVGSHVERGEVIGYVGATGLTTGPHLHYEFRVNGVPKNPETVDLPGAPPVPDKYMDEFNEQAQPLIAELKSVSRIMLAKNRTQAFSR